VNHFLLWAAVPSTSDMHTGIYSFSNLLGQAIVTVLMAETSATRQKQLNKGRVCSDSVQRVPSHPSGKVTVAGTCGELVTLAVFLSLFSSDQNLKLWKVLPIFRMDLPGLMNPIKELPDRHVLSVS
jgi:formate/nitrite transporter FocA (FNT family)